MTLSDSCDTHIYRHIRAKSRIRTQIADFCCHTGVTSCHTPISLGSLSIRDFSRIFSTTCFFPHVILQDQVHLSHTRIYGNLHMQTQRYAPGLVTKHTKFLKICKVGKYRIGLCGMWYLEY